MVIKFEMEKLKGFFFFLFFFSLISALKGEFSQTARVYVRKTSRTGVK